MALANRKIRIIWANHSVGRKSLDQDYYNTYRPHQGIHGKIPKKAK